MAPPTSLGSFAILPNELILLLASFLPARDVVALKDATHHLLGALDQRLDPADYLQSVGPFSRSHDLLDAMAAHGAVLSGSRALEYFVPGSVVEASDWDFYVPAQPSAATAMKAALESSGVTFETSLARAARKLRDESVVTLSCNHIISIAYEASLSQQTLPATQQIVIKVVHDRFPQLINFETHLLRNGSVRWLEGLDPIRIRSTENGIVSSRVTVESDYPFAVSSKVLHGTAQKGRKMIPVQLVIGAIDPRRVSATEPTLQTVFGSVFSFYASHVQCILTKHAALHMYYNLTVERVAYRWQVPWSIRGPAEAAVRKYTSRGFRFEEAPDGPVHRSAQDDGAYLLELTSGHNCTPTMSQIKSLTWYHEPGRLRPFVAPATMAAQRELLCFGIVPRNPF